MITRRMLVGMAAGAAAMQESTTIVHNVTPVSGGMVDGIAGGGILRGSGDAEVTFALSVFSLSGGTVQGVFRLEDDSDPSIPLLIESVRLDALEPLSEQSPDDRRVIGWATLNGGGEYPFLLQVLFGEAETELNLVLGADAEPFISDASAEYCDCGGFSYGIRSAIRAGDIVRFGSV